MKHEYGERPASKATVLACYLAIYFIWGSTYLGISISIRTAPIFLANAIRFVAAGAALVLIARGRGASLPNRACLAVSVKSGILSFFISFWLLTSAEQILPSSTAALIISLEPAWFVIFDWIFFSGAKPNRRIMLSQAVGFAGCAILVMGEGASARPAGISMAHYAASALSVVAASVAWVYGALLSSKSRDSHPDPAMASGLQMLSGGVVFTACAALAGDFSRANDISAESWLALAYLALFGSIVSYYAYILLLRTQPVSKVSTHSFVNPIVAVALGWAIAGEAVTIYTAAATSLVVASVIGIIYSNRR
ncbi:MAG: EamA family transporter [Synergistaceae bacterium]|nr:EamA family transporter [Synergistaceae bacterium]